MTRNELYNLLYSVRSKLKKQMSVNGRAPTICTDDALQEMTAHPPRNKSEFSNIAGLGDTFVSKYGEYFMPVFDRYYSSAKHTTPLTANVKETLQGLENRLVNISRKNRLLYMGRIQSKNAFDLHSDNVDYNNKVLDLILGKTTQLTLCEISLKDNWESDDKRFKRALQLIREITKDQRESGQYDLFIGYPYVVGKTFGEDFSIRAPLALFPVTFDKRPDKITIKLDKAKDILFNSNLILTQNKFVGNADEIPDVVWDDFDSSTFLESLLAHYQQYDIKINGSLDVLEKFEDISVKDFPEYRNGEFYLSNNAILGKFSPYSSAIQKDFRKLINSNEINVLIDQLLNDKADSSLVKHDTIALSEKDINYINELNSSQEQAILSSSQNNRLVIQGPPGTGKSQTITSLIADAVNKGQSVLMVSQKKAALDVIYSRLGKLSNFAVLLSDTKDKSAFYKQIHNLFACNKDSLFEISNFNEIANNIDNNVAKCEKIATSMQQNINSTPVHSIYFSNTDNFWLKCNDAEIFSNYSKHTNKDLLKINQKELINIFNTLNDNQLLADLIKYLEIANNYPFLKDIKQNLTTLDRVSMEKEFNDFNSLLENHKKQSFIQKLFKTNKIKKQYNKTFNKYFISKQYYKALFKDINKLLISLKSYGHFKNNHERYTNLNHNTQLYLNCVAKIYQEDIDSLININHRLLDLIIYCNIKDFEENNPSIKDIANFPTIISDTCSNMSDKIDLTKARVKNTLSDSFYNEIMLSKRYMEICRQLESNRKWSISKFMQKYSFELLRGIKVWLMTPETVSEILPMEHGLFDTLIFDEASQIYIEKGLPAISRANRVIISGDHKQLRPSSLGFGRIDIDDENIIEDEETTPALEEESLLDLARFKYPSVLLNYHYRSKYEELINFSNYAFYEGRLNVSPNTENPSNPPIEVVKIDNGMWINRCNKNEALKVVSIVKKFLQTRQNNETVGIITFNTNQRDAILDALDRECLKDQEFSAMFKKECERKDNGEDIGLFVKNIENVQGDERDHIIFSIGYAHNEDGKVVRNFGWLNQQGGENRLNVAISRAKRKITVVTSIFPEELTVSDLKNDGPKLFRKYLEYCWAINNKDNITASAILQSLSDTQSHNENDVNHDYIEEIGSILQQQGLEIEYNVGYGNYKVDLAIKSTDKSKYILGIEFDSKLYSNTNTRERDIFRQKYFACRNWHVYRLWSHKWWHNQQQELDNIINLYNKLNK